MKTKIFHKLSKKNKIIFILTILLNTCNLYASCGCAGGQTKCGKCGETQPICCNSTCNGYPFMLTRSQGRNSARELAGVQDMLYKYEIEKTNGFLSAAVEYQRSFDNQQIPRYFFGADYVNCKNLLIQGSQVNNRHQNAWLADYFGLPTDYNSSITFCPLLQNVIVDLNFYLGLDSITEGLYLKLVMPIAWTKSQLCPTEQICNAGVNNAIAGYLCTSSIARADLPASFLQYMNGSTFGDMQQPIKYGLITNNTLTEAGLAEFRTSIGYNFALEEDYHVGMFFELSAPTGNRPCGKYLFEPIIGNGKHWEIGGGLTGSWIFYRSKENENKYLGFWIDATLSYLAKDCQCRSFDISCKSSSRYMLLELMGLNTDKVQTVDSKNVSTESDYQYQKTLVPAINWSTFKIQTCIDLQTDIAAKLTFAKDNFSFDLGYNFWARIGEKFSIDNCCGCQPCYNMAIKGDAFIYGYYGQTWNNSIALAATESDANIHNGTNYPYSILNPGTNVATNPNIDSPKPAYSLDNTGTTTVALTIFGGPTNVNTSIQPTLIARGELNMDDSPAGLTHKLFLHFNYYKKNSDKKWLPFVGVGGEVEFATYRCKLPCCNSCCNSCNNCNNSCNNNCACPAGQSCSESQANYGTCTGPNSPYNCDFCCDPSCNKRMGVCQWGTWLKGGVSFN